MKVRMPYAIWLDYDGMLIWWHHPAETQPGRDVQYITRRYRPCNCRRVFIGGAR